MSRWERSHRLFFILSTGLVKCLPDAEIVEERGVL